MIHQIPLTEINKTHTSISNVGIDSYTITTTTNAASNGDGTSGGNRLQLKTQLLMLFNHSFRLLNSQIHNLVQRFVLLLQHLLMVNRLFENKPINARVIATDDEYYFDNSSWLHHKSTRQTKCQ